MDKLTAEIIKNQMIGQTSGHMANIPNSPVVFGNFGDNLRILGMKKVTDKKGNCCTTSSSHPNQYYLNNDSTMMRNLSPLEYERLQTLPDNYTEGVSNSQRYKMIGNGWTIDVVAHIFSYIGKKGRK